MRYMSFSMTTQQVRDGTKTVTRRQGWWRVKPGDVLMAVEKAQGLKKGEKVVCIRPIRVVATSPRRIAEIDQADCIAEGFPNLTPDEFIAMYCKANKVKPDDFCNRIVFVYVEAAL